MFNRRSIEVCYLPTYSHFTLYEPLDLVSTVGRTQPRSRYEALVGGLHLSPAYLVHDGAQSGIHVRVNPLWSRRLFKVAAGKLAGLDLTAEAVLGSVVQEVRERIAQAIT